MTKEFKLTMAQLNASVGDFDGNLNKARDAYSIACKEGADMLAFPEMFLTGYQTQDLVQKSAFVEAFKIADGNVEQVAQSLGISRATCYRKIKKYKN